MTVRKLAVLVDRPMGRLDRLAQRLATLGFGYSMARHHAGAIAVVERSPRLSLVAVDERVEPGNGPRLLAALRRTHPELPILWIMPRDGGFEPFTDWVPSAIVDDGIDDAALEKKVLSLLREQHYPDRLVGALCESAVGILREGFGTTLVARDPFLRANRAKLADTNAIVSFCGPEVAGHLLISGTAAHFERIRSRAVPTSKTTSPGQIGDLAAEIANQILGKVSTFLRKYVPGFERGLPVLLEGSDVVLRHTLGRPALVVPIEERDGTIYVELCFDRLRGELEVPVESPEEEMPDGEVVFFD